MNPETGPSNPDYERGFKTGMGMNADRAMLAERARIVALIEGVIQDELGRPIQVAPPQGIDEWGPVCAGCGAEEYRIDGFCSIDCRDRYGFAYEILTAIRESGPK